MKIEYVFFDCWDTVIHYGYKDEKKAYAELAEVYKHVKDKSQVSFEAFCQHKEEFMKQYYKETIYDVSIESILAYLVESLDLQLDCSYKKASDEMVKAYKDTLIPGLKDFTLYLKKKGVRCSVLSNTVLTQRHTQYVINSAYPHNPFELILASSYYAVKKPDPRFFLLGAQKVKADPKKALFIGDNFNTDIKGAYAAGMQPIYLNWKKHILPEEERAKVPNFIEVSSYQELIDFLEGHQDEYQL